MRIYLVCYHSSVHFLEEMALDSFISRRMFNRNHKPGKRPNCTEILDKSTFRDGSSEECLDLLHFISKYYNDFGRIFKLSDY